MHSNNGAENTELQLLMQQLNIKTFYTGQSNMADMSQTTYDKAFRSCTQPST